MATVAEGDVKHAIGSKGQGAAVVVPGRLADGHDDATGGWVDNMGVGGADFPFGDYGFVVEFLSFGHFDGEVYLFAGREFFTGVSVEFLMAEAFAVDETRVECEAEEAAFIKSFFDFDEAVGDVECRGLEKFAVFDDVDLATLIHDEEDVFFMSRGGGVNGAGELGGNVSETDLDLAAFDFLREGVGNDILGVCSGGYDQEDGACEGSRK